MNQRSALDCFLESRGWQATESRHYRRVRAHVFVNDDQTLSVFKETAQGILCLNSSSIQQQEIFTLEDLVYIRLVGYTIYQE